MRDHPASEVMLREIAVFALVIIVSVIGVIFVMHLWEANLSIPFTYSGDELFVGAMVKTLIESG